MKRSIDDVEGRNDLDGPLTTAACSKPAAPAAPIVITELTPRAVLGASLPSFYPGARNPPTDVVKLTHPEGLTLDGLQAKICDDDKLLWNQVRRFNGPWLLSHWDGDDDPEWLREEEEDENKHVRNSIIMASHDFMTRFEYDPSEVIGKDCKLLQGDEEDRNAESNSKLTECFKNGTDTHVNFINFKSNGEAFKSNLTMVGLYDSQGKGVFRLAHIKPCAV